MEINFSGTVNVIHAARESAVDRIVFVSSNSIYGDVEADDVRVTEEHPLNARNLYSIAKIASEMYCGRIQELSGLQIFDRQSEFPLTDRWNTRLLLVITCHWFIRSFNKQS